MGKHKDLRILRVTYSAAQWCMPETPALCVQKGKMTTFMLSKRETVSRNEVKNDKKRGV